VRARSKGSLSRRFSLKDIETREAPPGIRQSAPRGPLWGGGGRHPSGGRRAQLISVDPRHLPASVQCGRPPLGFPPSGLAGRWGQVFGLIALGAGLRSVPPTGSRPPRISDHRTFLLLPARGAGRGALTVQSRSWRQVVPSICSGDNRPSTTVGHKPRPPPSASALGRRGPLRPGPRRRNATPAPAMGRGPGSSTRQRETLFGTGLNARELGTARIYANKERRPEGPSSRRCAWSSARGAVFYDKVRGAAAVGLQEPNVKERGRARAGLGRDSCNAVASGAGTRARYGCHTTSTDSLGPSDQI